MRAVVRSIVFIACGLAVAARAAYGAPERVDEFGDNPGDLEMWKVVPSSASENAPLVVVLHGCTQQASSLAPAGFEALAEELGFYLLYPQQKSANNPVGCFNWAGEYGDAANLTRGQGENQSIMSMVEAMKAAHSIDPARVYVLGFSAGAAFTAVMLATWPDAFAAGAIAAGVPYRCATDQAGAFACMNLGSNADRKKTPAQWGDLVRAGDPGWTGPWPRVLVMHGTADATVHPDAATELIEQWTDVHGAGAEPDETTEVAGHTRARYVVDGKTVVESWRLEGMGHAFPVGADPDHACGQTAAFFEDQNLCGAYRALSFFGIVDVDVDGDGDGDESGDGDHDGEADADTSGGGGCAAGGSASGAGAFAVLIFLGVAISSRRRRAG